MLSFLSSKTALYIALFAQLTALMNPDSSIQYRSGLDLRRYVKEARGEAQRIREVRMLL